eukprot:gb/GFBE01046456.1/.p1 GENE.gb/GFBE01046456.1/~~gb/GFBE01046456.1/.p1  ORF type:complete len:508 (+),score=140.30 gb/GFBE01046456.1/:1-1524(+)
MALLRSAACIALFGASLTQGARVEVRAQEVNEKALETEVAPGLADEEPDVEVADGFFDGDRKALEAAFKGKHVRVQNKYRVWRRKSALGVAKSGGAKFKGAIDKSYLSSLRSARKVEIVQQQLGCGDECKGKCKGAPPFASKEQLAAEVEALEKVKGNNFTAQFWGAISQNTPGCSMDYHYMILDRIKGYAEKPGVSALTYELSSLIKPQTAMNPDRMSQDEIVLYLGQAAIAIFEAHKAGVVHLAVQPDAFALDGEVWDKPRAAKLRLSNFAEAITFDGAAALADNQEPVVKAPREVKSVYDAPEFKGKEEAWPVISESYACETNSEGIVRLDGKDGHSLDSCKEWCRQTAGCLAIDFYESTEWCNIYDTACTTPGTMGWFGEKSYRYVPAVEAAIGPNADWWSFGMMAATMAVGSPDLLKPFMNVKSHADVQNAMEKFQPSIDAAHPALFNLLKTYLLKYEPSARLSSFDPFEAEDFDTFWEDKFWTLGGKKIDWKKFSLLSRDL